MNPAEETSSPAENPSTEPAMEAPAAVETAAAPPAEKPPQDQQGRKGRGAFRGERPRRDGAPQGGVDNPEPKAKPALNASGRKLRRLIDEDLGDELEQAMAGLSSESAMTAFEASPASAPAAKPGGRNEKQKDEKKSYRVIDVRGGDVFVDLGGKSEGVLSGLQFPEGAPKAGDMVEAFLERRQVGDGVIRLRRPGEAESADWGSLAKGMIVDAQVKKVNKGGLEVTVNGIRAFMPAAQVSLDFTQDLNVFLNQTLRSQVMEVNADERNLVVSRKEVMKREREEKAQETLATLKEGEIREGVVKRLQDFGAFIDIGGVDGLLPISQMAWHRVKHPGDILQVGQEVKVQVMSFNPETKKISFSLKELLDSPWTNAAESYSPGKVVNGVVTRVTDFGAFVELEQGIEGLVHISELSPNRVRRAADVAKPGQAVEVKVLTFDAEQKRIGLSIKQAIPVVEEEKPVAAVSGAAIPEEPEAEPAKPKKPPKDLKGGLGGSGGPLFG